MKNKEVVLKERLKEKYGLNETFIEILIKICKDNSIKNIKKVIEKYLKKSI